MRQVYFHNVRDYVCIYLLGMLILQVTPCSFVELPKIIEVSGFTVHEGGNTTLKCLAEGKPTPSITWTRLSDGSNITWTRLPGGSVISRTLVNITRQSATVGYRCIAANGVGNPDIRDVFIDVQCECSGCKIIYLYSFDIKVCLQNNLLLKFPEN